MMDIYNALYERYGDLKWWPAKTPYEVMTGAVLTQNTSWSNVEKAIGNFGNRLTPEFVLNADTSELAEIIRPSGYYNQKAGCLKALTLWYSGYSFDSYAVGREQACIIRKELLSVRGIGKETADSVMLYAFGFMSFVVDAYTIRLCERLPVNAGVGYDAVKAHFEGILPKNIEIYKNFHAMIVINAKEHCRKKPACGGCPLEGMCGCSKRS